MKAAETTNEHAIVAADDVGCIRTPASETQHRRDNGQLPELLCYLVLLTLFCAIFAQAIFRGDDVSKFYCLAEWDSLFDAVRRGPVVNGDPSAVLMYVPTYMYIAKVLHAGALPLWNSLSSFGCPLIGDIQSTVLSPFRLLFDCFPSLRFYNLAILTNVALACGGTFLFARTLGVGRLGATFAALAYGFCPYFLWYAELWGVGYALNPIVGTAFVLAARKRTVLWSIVAGVASGITVISSHPEHSFFVIAFSTLLLFCLAQDGAAASRRHAADGVAASRRHAADGVAASRREAADGAAASRREAADGVAASRRHAADGVAASRRHAADGVAASRREAADGAAASRRHALLNALVSLFVAGATALCVAAPVFLPFLEFLKNSDCYKFDLSNASTVPWQAFAFNCASPGFSAASPYLGVLLLPLAVFALAEREQKRNMVASFITLLTALCIATEVWPLSAIAKHPPFIYIMTTYATPVVLLYASVFAAFGVKNLHRLLTEKPRLPLLLSAALVLTAVLIAPPLLAHANLSSGNFDMTLPDMSFNSSAWKTGIWCAIASVSVVCVSFFWKKLKQFAALILVILNFVSVVPVMKRSLPATKPFELPQSEVMTFLQHSGERTLAIGTHLCKPDVNLLFGVDDIRSINPMFPKRYIKFINACGVGAAEYSPVFKDNLTPVLDLGSVRYILSNAPVSCSEDRAPNMVPLDNVHAEVACGITLDSASIWASPEEHGAGGFVHFQNAAAGGDLTFMLVLLDPANTSVWYSDTIPFRSLADGNYRFTAALPVDASDMTKFRLGVRVFDPVKIQFLDTEPRVLGHLQNTHESAKHFRFFREFSKRFRVYSNDFALPRAYLVPNAKFVDSADKALQLIKDRSFDKHQSVILEAAQQNEIANVTSAKTGAGGLMHQTIDVQRSNPNETVVNYDSAFDGYLVLTDSFYPGWNAYLDDKRTQIMRANYMFRGIHAPRGKHRVLFKYEPLSVLIGFIMQIGFVSLCLLLFVSSKLRKPAR